MKKSIVVLLCVVSLIVGGIAGFIIGTQAPIEKENDFVGTYKTNTWNGKEAFLVLKEDGTCIFPTGDSGTWTVDNDEIIIDCPDLAVPDLEVSSIRNASIVPNGIMLSGHFFEKLK